MKNYWDAVVKSHLLDPQAKKKAIAHLKSLSSEKKKDPAEFGNWLIDNGWISQYHHENLMMSLPGPFRFGPVLVHGQMPGPSFQESHCCLIQSQSSGSDYSIPTIASFIEENTAPLIESLANEIQKYTSVQHPHLLPPAGFVQAGDSSMVLEPVYSFWESNVPKGFWKPDQGKGKLLSQILLPKKGIPSKGALQIIADVAFALSQLEKHSLFPIFLTPASVVVSPKGRAVVRLTPDPGLCGQSLFDFFDRVMPCESGIHNAALINSGKRKPLVKVGDRPAKEIEELALKKMEDRRWCFADYLPKEILSSMLQYQHGELPTDSKKQNLAKQKNLFSLGVLLHQLLVGSLPFQGSTLEEKIDSRENSNIDLPKDLPEKIQALLQKLLSTDPTLSTEKVAGFLYKSLKSSPLKTSPFSQAPKNQQIQPIIDQWLASDSPGLGTDEKEPETSEQEPVADQDQRDTGNPFSKMKMERRVDRGKKKPSNKPNHAKFILLGSITALAIGFVCYSVFIGLPFFGSNDGGDPSAAGANDPGSDPELTAGNGVTKKDHSNKTLQDVGWIQKIVPDDGNRLWESPTTGSANRILNLPNGPSAVVLINPSFWDLSNSTKLLASFRLEADDESSTVLGFPLSFWRTWDQTDVGLYDQENQHFDSVFSFHSKNDSVEIPLDDWKVAGFVNERKSKQLKQILLVNQKLPNWIGHCWVNSKSVLEARKLDLAKQAPEKIGVDQSLSIEKIEVKKFWICNRTILKDGLDEDSMGSLDRNLNAALPQTDKDRHLQWLVSTTTLKGPKADWLVGEYWKKVPFLYQMHWPLSVRANYFSAHWDDQGACYLEAKFLVDSRRKSGGFLQLLQEKVSSIPESVELAIRRLPPHPSWDRILVKYDDMVRDTVGRIRYGFHNKAPTLNCWLPPSADRNLIAGTAVYLYGLRFQDNGGSAVATNSGGTSKPKIGSVEDLLKLNWDLDIPEQDLVNAVAELKSDILAEHGDLPFEFDLKLDGNALKMDGITQNQKITNFVAKQKSIESILTQIAVTANPDQNVSKPNDPGCKLIWVLQKSGKQQTILFTTRAAAKTNNWAIPSVFKTE